MKILLIDADSVIPNLALMKLSTYHKSKGDDVILVQLHIPYYPNRKKELKIVDTSGYDRSYCSVVFFGNKEWVQADRTVFGGTGHDLTINLPDNIEQCDPDYSIYPDNNISYGYITRGCIRNCPFCVVPQKEGKIHQVRTVDQIVRHKKVKFLDNNILAFPGHKEILQELIDKNIRHQFNQGLDIRCIDEENSILLSRLNYINGLIFAFDDWKYKSILDRKLPLLSWRKDWEFKFFVYVHPDMQLEEINNRVVYLRERKIIPYIMRDITCWNSKYKDYYTDIAAWCNQTGIFKKMSFDTFLTKRYKNIDRIRLSSSLYSKQLVY